MIMVTSYAKASHPGGRSRWRMRFSLSLSLSLAGKREDPCDQLTGDYTL
jgi:hypothetical protein